MRLFVKQVLLSALTV